MSSATQTLSISDAVKLALEDCDAGRLPRAEQIYRQILDTRPGNADLLHLLGVIARRVGKAADALALIAQAIERDPNEPSYFNSLGDAHRALGRIDDALDSYRRAVEIEPDFGEALSSIGETQRGQSKLDEAAASYRRALEIAPDDARVHCNLGVVFEEQGELEQAVARHRRALAIEPKLALASYNLGHALHRMGRLDAAAAAYRSALDTEPDLAEAHNNLGSVLREQSKPDEAIAHFRRAIACDPRFVRPLGNLAIVHREQGNLDEATADCRRALEVDPNNAKARSNLASVLGAQERQDEALVAYRMVLELDPHAATAKHMVAALTGTTTDTAAEGYVQNLFDGCAHRFERHVVDALGYRVPELMREMIDRVTRGRLLPGTGRFRRALDIGCGTGLVGAAVHDIVDELEGVDISAKMIDQSRRKALYNALYVDDAAAFLGRSAEHGSDYDLIVAADVFIYVGRIDAIFAAARRRLAEGGLFVFSVETLDRGDYALRQSGRYAQSDNYIHRLAREYDLAIEARLDVVVRTENDIGIEGAVFVLTPPPRNIRKY